MVGVGLDVGVTLAETVTVVAVDWAEVTPELSVNVTVIEKEPEWAGAKLNVEAVWPD